MLLKFIMSFLSQSKPGCKRTLATSSSSQPCRAERTGARGRGRACTTAARWRCSALTSSKVPVEEWISKAAFALLQPQLAHLRAPHGGDTQAGLLQADGFSV